MRTLTQGEGCQVAGGVEAVPALPGTVVTRAVLMGSWVPWSMGVASFGIGFGIGTYIYDNFGTEIVDGIEAVLN